MRKPRTHSSRAVFENQWITVKEDILKFDQNRTYPYTYVAKHHNGVMVVPYFEETNSLLLTQQYRHPVQKVVYGFPGGAMEDGQEPQAEARREMLEETGYQASELIDIGYFMPDVGIQSDVGQLYVALNPKKVTDITEHSDEENTLPVIKSVDEIKQLVADDEIRDGWSLGPLLVFLLWLERRKESNVTTAG